MTTLFEACTGVCREYSRLIRLLMLALLGFAAAGAQAQFTTGSGGLRVPGEGGAKTGQGVDTSKTSSIKLGFSHDSLTANQASWSGSYMQVESRLNPDNFVSLRLERANRFSDSGTLVAGSWTRDLSPSRYFTANYTWTNRGTFWPISQTSLGLSQKFLDDKSLVGTVLIGRNISRNDYRDWLASVSMAYYSKAGFVYEAGLRTNQSNPGSISTSRVFGAITYGTQGQRYLSATLNGGKEGYQLSGNTVATNFSSQSLVLGWKEWIGRDWGTEVKLGFYKNSTYQRTTIDAAAFLEF